MKNSKLRLVIIIQLIFWGCFSHQTFAQKRFVDATVKFKSAKTSSKVKLVVYTLAEDADEIDLKSFANKIEIIKDFEIIKIRKQEIEKIQFSDFKGNTIIFDIKNVENYDYNRSNLVIIKFEGRISWFQDIVKKHDGKKVIAGGIVGGAVGGLIEGAIGGLVVGATTSDYCLRNYLKKEGGSEFEYSTDLLIHFTEDRPDLKSRILKIESDEDLNEILMDYEIGIDSTISKYQDSSYKYQLLALERTIKTGAIPILSAHDLVRGDKVIYEGVNGNVNASFVEVKSEDLVIIEYKTQDETVNTSIVPLVAIKKIILNEE